MYNAGFLFSQFTYYSLVRFKLQEKASNISRNSNSSPRSMVPSGSPFTAMCDGD